MLDDLRDQSGDSFFIEDDEEGEVSYSKSSNPTTTSSLFLGMTPVQRFIIAVMVFFIVSVIGIFFLLVTGKLYLPVF